MTRGIRLTGFLAVALLAALVVFLSTNDSRAAAPPFEPGGMYCFDILETGTACDGDTAPGAATDIFSKFCIGWNDDCSVKDTTITDSNFGAVVGFTPASWGLPKGDTVPIGAIAGRLESEATLGLIGNPCNNGINVAFTMLNSSINVSQTIAPREEGRTDVMEPLALDADPANGVPDGADKYPKFLADFFSINGQPIQPRARLFGITHISGSWVSLNFVYFDPGVTLEVAQSTVTFDPNLGYPSITILQDPTAQAAPSAITDFCAPLLSLNTALGKTINNPCTPASVEGANCPVTSDIEPETVNRGYPAFPCDSPSKFDDDGDGKVNDGCPQVNNVSETGAQCDNKTSDDGEDAAVNDGCPASGAVSEGSRMPGACSAGDEGGCDYRTNPTTAGDAVFTTLAASLRDADGDGIPNSLDVCFDKPNGEWNPYAEDKPNDTDLDGLPNACDPHPADKAAQSPNGCKSGITGPDEDQDCFSNRADNCPVVSQLKDPTQPADNYPETNANPPLAPDDDSDGIGDKCDPDPAAPNGDYIGYCLKMALHVGGANGAVVGVRQTDKLVPDCAAQVISTPTPVGQTATPRPSGGSANTGGNSGVGAGPSSGVGSLAPTGADVPLWAAILAGLGAAGLVSGLALYARLAPRRHR